MTIDEFNNITNKFIRNETIKIYKKSLKWANIERVKLIDNTLRFYIKDCCTLYFIIPKYLTTPHFEYQCQLFDFIFDNLNMIACYIISLLNQKQLSDLEILNIYQSLIKNEKLLEVLAEMKPFIKTLTYNKHLSFLVIHNENIYLRLNLILDNPDIFISNWNSLQLFIKQNYFIDSLKG